MRGTGCATARMCGGRRGDVGRVKLKLELSCWTLKLKSWGFQMLPIRVTGIQVAVSVSRTFEFFF